MDKKNKVYISLPINGYDIDERKDTAMKMEVKLRGRGYDVFNPLGNGWVDGLTGYDYMRHDLKGLLDCDTIFLMHGWEHSVGCKIEFDVAVSIGLDVWFEDLSQDINI